MIQPTFDILYSWLTPTSVFLVVNLVIGTIAITSHFYTPKRTQEQHRQHQQNQHDQQEEFFDNCMSPLSRGPSLLDRVKSINLKFYNLDSHAPESEPRLTRAPSLLERVNSFKFPTFYREKNSGTGPETRLEDDEPGRVQEVKRCTSESNAKKKAVGMPKMQKSASEKISCFVEEEECVVEKRRPATVRIAPTGDQEINEKADDFISKFKKQLRLQRLDSILKYRSSAE